MYEKRFGFVAAIFAAWVMSASVARAGELGEDIQGKPVNVILEAGYRYPILGQGYIPGDGFPVTYHIASTFMFDLAGGSGLYMQARYDGFAPRGRGYPMMGSARLGYYFNIHRFEAASINQSTSYDTVCGSVYCTTYETTRQWYEPPGWVSGAMYFYGGYRQGFHFEGDVDETSGLRKLAFPGAASVGIGFIETKFATFLNELEVLYWPFGWQDSGRSKWGFYYHGAAMFGPFFIDFTGILDAGIGGELSVGLGFNYAL